MRFNLINRVKQKLIIRRDNEPLPIKLHKRRIYILPTRFGLFLAIVLLIMLLGSLNYNNNMALMLSFMMMSLSLISMLYTQRNLLDLVLHEIHTEPVFAGEMVIFQVHAKCQNAVGHQNILISSDAEQVGCNIPPAAHGSLKLHCKSKRRGYMSMPRVSISSEYPLGLFRTWAYSQPRISCLIYPQPEADPPPLPTWIQGSGTGSANLGDDEFAGIREYSAGDPVRMIAWKASARNNKLMTRIQQNATQQKIDLNWHQAAGLDTESRISRLTAWVLLASGRDMRFSLALPGLDISRGCGDSHRRDCLEALALWRQS